MTPPLDVLYQDDHVLAVNKPNGLLVHRGWGRDTLTLVTLVRRHLGGGTVHPIHRLDRPTSGVVLFALNPTTARHLNDLFAQQRVTKRYLALVRGHTPDEGLIDHPIPRQVKGERVPAQTAFQRLHTANTEPRHVSLVLATPITGRAHQIRRHLKHINHPMIGDTRYGRSTLNRAFRENYNLTRLGLHAWTLSVPFPEGHTLNLRAPLPDDLIDAWTRMGFPLADLDLLPP